MRVPPPCSIAVTFMMSPKRVQQVEREALQWLHKMYGDQVRHAWKHKKGQCG